MTAGVADGAGLAGVEALTIAASGDHDALSSAIGGAAGGDLVATPVAALTLNFNDTSAIVGTGDALTAASIDASAQHDGNTETTSAGDMALITN